MPSKSILTIILASSLGTSLASPLSNTLLTTRSLNSADHTALAHKAFTTLAKQICIGNPNYYSGALFGTHGWGPNFTKNGGLTLNFGERQYGINADGTRFWKGPGRQNCDLQSFTGPGCDDYFLTTGTLSGGVYCYYHGC